MDDSIKLVNLGEGEMAKRVPWYSTTWGRMIIASLIISIIALILGIIGTGVGSAGLAKANDIDVNPTTFTINSNFTTESDILAYSSCTNSSITDAPDTFTEEAGISYMCPILQDTCNVNTCYESDGKCHEVLDSTSTCSSSFPCPAGSTCDLETCNCVPNTNQQCTVDNDCMRIIDNPVCQEVVCASGQCVRRTAFGFDCSTNAECAANQFCNNLCLCVTSGSGSLPTAITYTPVVANAQGTDAIDWNNFFVSPTEFFYIENLNFVRINFRITAEENVTNTDPIRTAFTFTLPLGFPANTLGFRGGTAVLSPNQALPSFFSDEFVLYSTTTISTYVSGDVLVSFNNANPAFIGPLLGSLVTVSGYFEYEYLIV